MEGESQGLQRVKQLLEENVTLSDESKRLFNAIVERVNAIFKRLRVVVILNGFFIILTIASMIFFMPAAVRMAVDRLQTEQQRTRIAKDSIEWLIQVNRRARDSVEMERTRNEAKISELKRLNDLINK